MKRCILAMVIIGFFAVQGYCQDNQSSANQNTTPAAAVAVAPTPATTEKASQPQEISIYGEVKTVNPSAGSITVQYYDYDSDEEKSIDIVTDAGTKMENAATINDIKQGNWADIIYTSADGKNTAKSIIVEKEEEAPAEMPKAEEKPAAEKPAAMPQQQ
jgi:Cu/Ag efflux protein CusF